MIKGNLDKRICDVVPGVKNIQTYREFIRESENEFKLSKADLDGMNESKLNLYLDFLDELWSK